MTDRIELRGLRVLGRHGALAGEQDTAQPFEIDLEVEADFGEAALDDDLAKTVDYSLVVEEAMEIVDQRQSRLLETLAEVGSKSLPLVAAAGAAIGVVISMEARYSLSRFGAKSMFST